MCVRFLRSSESPHVSVFYLSATSLTVSLAATLIPKALGYHGSIRMPHGRIEWAFMLGVGASWARSPACPAWLVPQALGWMLGAPFRPHVLKSKADPQDGAGGPQQHTHAARPHRVGLQAGRRCAPWLCRALKRSKPSLLACLARPPVHVHCTWGMPGCLSVWAALLCMCHDMP